MNARTGCIGCPLASKDLALETIVAADRWSHLAPLRRLKPIYRELRKPENRLRKPGAELPKSGAVAKNPQRMGPMTFAARLRALEQDFAVQAEVKEAAAKLEKPMLDLLSAEEEACIRELVDPSTCPDPPPTCRSIGFPDGTVQPLFLRR